MILKWTCPFCKHDTIITGTNYSEGKTTLTIDNSDGTMVLRNIFIVCPNQSCNKVSLTSMLLTYEFDGRNWQDGKLIKNWNLIPQSTANVYPSYIPKAILDDYLEACSIKDLSPKASATLSRRCLQGIIRDFWGVRKKTLVEEIKEIEEKIDPLTWKAIEAIRKIGNIGAHMESDINTIIEVDSVEAEKLIELLELLISDWYINKHEREEKLKAIITISEQKNAHKSSPMVIKKNE